MREILFRGKRADNGEWVHGGYMAYDCDSPFGKMVKRSNIVSYEEGDGNGFWFEVDPETVGQCTGLTDKYGVKIFDGDLLNGFFYPYLSDNAHNYFAEVVWFENSSAFGLVTHKHPQSAVRGISEGNADYMEEFDSSDWEVIGNIHDNPELLTEAT